MRGIDRRSFVLGFSAGLLVMVLFAGLAGAVLSVKAQREEARALQAARQAEHAARQAQKARPQIHPGRAQSIEGQEKAGQKQQKDE